MKLLPIASLLIGSIAWLHAAEPVPFSYRMLGAAERVVGDGPIAPQNAVKASVKEDGKWGMQLRIELKKTEPNTMYRIRFEAKGAAGVHFRDDTFPEKNTRVAAGKGIITLFGSSDDAKPGCWGLVFAREFKQVEIPYLAVEKIAPEEYSRNLLADEGLEPGYWHGLWGKQDGCCPKLIEEEESPAGKLLRFAAGKPGDGHPSTMPLPYLPGRKYEISFWIRGNTEDMIRWQVAFGGIKLTRIGLKKTWTQVKMTGMTPDKERRGGMFLMFVGNNKPLPEMEIGGVDFHYLP